MRLLVIQPSQTLISHLHSLEMRYEIVESAETLSAAFTGHNGIFDGVIARNNPAPGEIRTIGQNPYVQLRELPIFVYGNRLAAKQQFEHVTAKGVTCAYRGNLRDELKKWTQQLAEQVE
jgi:hypothetical protein